MVGTRATDKGELLKVSIGDTGIGIIQEKLKTIFNKQTFAREDDKTLGLGMGLYICKEICLLHSGNIWVESQRGKGTSFHFTLPNITMPEHEAEAEVKDKEKKSA